MMLSETTTTNPVTVTTTLKYLHGLDLIAQNDGTNTQYVGYDGLGSVRQLADSAGVLKLSQTFDPYGNPYANAGPGKSGLGSDK